MAGQTPEEFICKYATIISHVYEYACNIVTVQKCILIATVKFFAVSLFY